jgi:autotransporter-associated beta strand protein
MLMLTAAVSGPMAFTHSPAFANNLAWNFNFSGSYPGGGADKFSGQFITTALDTVRNNYTILAISGIDNGQAITGLIPRQLYGDNDNYLYPSGSPQVVDNFGFSFAVGPVDHNVYDSSGSTYADYSSAGWSQNGSFSVTQVYQSNLTWADNSADNLWNVASSVNWNNGSGSAVFNELDNVTFSDASGGNYAVTLNTSVWPGSIVVNNTAGNYVISGTGAIVGTAGLTKMGIGSLVLNTGNSYAGGTSVNAGALIAGVNGALPEGPVTINGGTIQLASSTGAAQITSLDIPGNGALDITNNHMLIDYGSGPDPIATITAYVTSGFNGGAWNGPGIISSTVASTPGYSVGYADSADPGNPAGLSPGTIEIKYTLLGDADLNGTVNGIDFGILAANFNKTVSRWDQGDFNYDNIVNGLDFTALAANFNMSASSASDVAAIDAFAAANGLLADVPEPAFAGVCLIVTAGFLSRRRRVSKPAVS